MENEGEERKRYNMRTDAERKEVYPKVKVKKIRRKKYELRQLAGPGVIEKYEWLVNNHRDPPDFLKVLIDSNIQHGIFTTKEVAQNEVLLEYKGDLITREESIALHRHYAKIGMGCYIVDFVHNEQKLCIDATMALDTLGRCVNDSIQRYANCEMKKFIVDEVPHLFLVAKKEIPALHELRYDYGDHRENLQWRGLTQYKKPFVLSDVVNAEWFKNSDFLSLGPNNNFDEEDEKEVDYSQKRNKLDLEQEKVGITTISNVKGEVTSTIEEVWVK